MDERLIQTFYYAIGGIFLGVMIALAWSFYIDTNTSSIQIVLITAFISAFYGFLFPHFVPHWFKAFWNFFT
ncbi:hypothetical protein B9T30_14520 [Acinetobacter sp. ANC 4973]|nr:hypothetical protein B9T30_14520 [Acinetobacter sp. ANC 4973]